MKEMVKLLPIQNELEIYGYHVSEIYLIHPRRNQQNGKKLDQKIGWMNIHTPSSIHFGGKNARENFQDKYKTS